MASYYDQFYPGNTGVTNVTMDPSIYPGVGATEAIYSDALSPDAPWDPTWGPMGPGGAWGQTPYGPTRASAGMAPYVPPDTGYIPLSQPDPYYSGDYTASQPLGPQNKPWEATDPQMLVGMTASNIIPTRDQPRIMGGDRGGSAGGVAKGAIQGAMIGSKFGAPWWGAAIGATAGLLGFMDTTTPPQIIPAQIKRGSRTAFPQVPQTSSYYPGLLNNA